MTGPDSKHQRWLIPLGVLTLLTVLAVWIIPVSTPYEIGDHRYFTQIHNYFSAQQPLGFSLLGTGTPTAPYMHWMGVQLGGDATTLASGLMWLSLALALVTCSLIMWVSYQYGGLLAAGFSGLFLVGNPNYMAFVFAPQTEIILGAVFFLLAIAMTFSYRNRRWLPLLAILVCLALGVDHHGAYILIGILVAAAAFGREKSPAPTGGEVALAPFSISFLAAIVCGVILFALSWPWLQEETSSRLIEYLVFPFSEPQPDLLVRGTLWESTASWYVAIDLFFSRLPLVQSIALIVGLWSIVPRLWRSTDDTSDSRGHLLPFLCVFLTGIILCSLNGSPYYSSGTQYLSVYAPFIALFAGLGATQVAKNCLRHPVCSKRQSLATGILILSLTGPGLLHSGRTIPSHGEFIGTLEGGPLAVRSGWTSRFSGLPFHSEVTDWLQNNARNHTVSFLPEFGRYRPYIDYQQEQNLLSGDIKVERPSSADILVVPAIKQHPQWSQTTDLFRSVERQDVISIDGEPLYHIYFLGHSKQ